jgi:flagellin
MASINTNVSSLIAQRALSQSQSSLSTALERLSTGLRINTGEDDPAGLIASEGLKSEIAGINEGISNSQQASNVISTAEGALSEVSSLLLTIKGLVVESANSGALSPDELAANQLQIDSAVQSITRISNTTTFAGLPLINGSLGYVTSGVDTSKIDALTVSQADLGSNASIPINVDVLTSARTAALEYTASSVAHSVTLQVSGNIGTQTLSFTSGTSASAIAYAVNSISDSTGVTANLTKTGSVASGITFGSTGYGSASFVSVTAQTGSFNTVDTSGNAKTRSTGQDAVATINGALTTGAGLDLKVNTNALNLDLTLDKSMGIGKTSFSITGGGALFQLGPQVDSGQQVSIGIQSVAASQLGNSTIGYLNDIATGGDATVVGGKSANASQIVEQAITQVADLSGRLGAFAADTLNTNVDSLNVALENVTSSESNIADANFAAETANLTRAQILTQAGTSVLATANSTPQQVLTLLPR